MLKRNTKTEIPKGWQGKKDKLNCEYLRVFQSVSTCHRGKEEMGAAVRAAWRREKAGPEKLGSGALPQHSPEETGQNQISRNGMISEQSPQSRNLNT